MLVRTFFFFKKKTAYEMRISDWSSDVCSSELHPLARRAYRKTAEPKKRKLASLFGIQAPAPRDLTCVDKMSQVPRGLTWPWHAAAPVGTWSQPAIGSTDRKSHRLHSSH